VPSRIESRCDIVAEIAARIDAAARGLVVQTGLPGAPSRTPASVNRAAASKTPGGRGRSIAQGFEHCRIVTLLAEVWRANDETSILITAD